MEKLYNLNDFRIFRKNVGASTLGFVPTMGALHAGHESLIQRSSKENQVTVVSIFVNPSQFNDPKDFEKYPKTTEKDLEIAQAAGASAVFLPTVSEIYPKGFHFKITEHDISKHLCGQFRPGHFDGVLTVVSKLFNIVAPHRAYFGEKDFQQLQLIRNFVSDFFLPIQIKGCPTLREKSGLAMSSRNIRLSKAGLEIAPRFFEFLSAPGLSLNERNLKLEQAGFTVEYMEEKWGRRLSAVNLEGVRLIDNVDISAESFVMGGLNDSRP